MTHNKTEDELLDLQDDEKTSDTFDVDDRLQDGTRITCNPNKDATPASLHEISLLTSPIQILSNRLPGVLYSPLLEAQMNEKCKLLVIHSNVGFSLSFFCKSLSFFKAQIEHNYRDDDDDDNNNNNNNHNNSIY